MSKTVEPSTVDGGTESQGGNMFANHSFIIRTRFPVSDTCSRRFNNVILEKGDNRTVGWCNADLCQRATRLPVIITQTAFGAGHGTHAETTADGFQQICWLLATSTPALNSYFYF